MSKIIVFLLLNVAILPVFALTSDEREREIQVWNKMESGWSHGRDEWNKELLKAEKEFRQLKEKTDTEARIKQIKEKAIDMIKKAPKGIGESLSGDTKKAALTGFKAAKDFIDARKAEGELIDIVLDDSENSEKLAELEKKIGDLNSTLSDYSRALFCLTEDCFALDLF
jgi:hypothetical protein